MKVAESACHCSGTLKETRLFVEEVKESMTVEATRKRFNNHHSPSTHLWVAVYHQLHDRVPHPCLQWRPTRCLQDGRHTVLWPIGRPGWEDVFSAKGAAEHAYQV